MILDLGQFVLLTHVLEFLGLEVRLGLNDVGFGLALCALQGHLGLVKIALKLIAIA